MAITTEKFSGPRLYGYVARPADGARSGVLILPTIYGVNEFARGYADILAHAGLAAAVWDINSGQPLVTDYQECIRRARTLSDRGVAGMLKDWTDMMTSEMHLASTGVLGFCIGGRFALLKAADDKSIKACAIAYPSIESPRLPSQELDALALASDIACPVHMLQPGNDHVTHPETYETLKQALCKRKAPTIVQLHPEAEHGFMHREKPEENRVAAAIASPQVVAFLGACLARSAAAT
jgi:carboxymethylenebutenolidase